MFTKESIIENVHKLSEQSEFPVSTFIVSSNAALRLNNAGPECEVLNIEVLPHNFIKLCCLYPQARNVYKGAINQRTLTEFVDELKLYVQEGLMSVTSLLIPNVEIVVTNGIHHRTTASVVDVKRHLCSPKDYMDIVSLGFRP